MATLLQIPVQSFSNNRALSSPSTNGEIRRFRSSVSSSKFVRGGLSVRAVKEKVEGVETPDEFTKKFGLEAGLWKVSRLFILFDTRLVTII